MHETVSASIHALVESAHERVLAGVKSGVRKQEPGFFTGLLKTSLFNEECSPHGEILAVRFESEKITEEFPMVATINEKNGMSASRQLGTT
jgi:hypothetical protein